MSAPCRCGCERPGTYAGWHNAMCRKRFKRHGGPMPMAKCSRCGGGLAANAKGDICGRCENVDATAGHRRGGMVATLAKALGTSDPFPLEASSPSLPLLGLDLNPARDPAAFRMRLAERGYTPATCPRCNLPAWKEPPVTRTRDGVTSVEECIRCANCNPVRSRYADKKGAA